MKVAKKERKEKSKEKVSVNGDNHNYYVGNKLCCIMITSDKYSPMPVLF